MSHDLLQGTPEQERGISVIRSGLIELDAARPFQFPLQPGQQLNPLNQIMEETADKIAQIAPSLSLHLSRAIAWGSELSLIDDQRSLIANLPEAQTQIIREKILPAEAAMVSQLSTAVEQQERSVALEPGLLAIPPYRQQEGERTCMGATFLSMFQALTGISISEKQFLYITREKGFMTDMDSVSEEVLALFMTNAFRTEFPNRDVTVYTAGGFDFTQLKARAAEAQQAAIAKGKVADVYFLPALKSEVMDERNIFHITTLIAADDNTIIIHDPSDVLGSQFRPMHRHDFMQRWGQGLFRGKLIIANH